MAEHNEIQDLIAQLSAKGWTYSAIADELGSDYRTLWQWRTGRFSPANAKAIALALRHLLGRKRIPKKKRGRRYSGSMRNVEAPPENDGQT